MLILDIGWVDHNGVMQPPTVGFAHGSIPGLLKMAKKNKEKINRDDC